MARVFEDANVGDLVMVLRNDRFVNHGKIVRVSSTTVKIMKGSCNWGFYSRKTGEERGRRYIRAVPATQEQIDAANAAQQAEDREERERRRREDEARRQAEFDALPEEVRLARKLRGFCDVYQSPTIAKMPLNILRAAVKWIEENRYECQ